MLRIVTGARYTPVLWVLLFARQSVAAPGDIINLGVADGDSTIAYGMSGAGHVAGEFHTPTGNFGAYRYDPALGGTGVTYNLGTLGGTNADARDVNANGQVAGVSNTAGNSGRRAFRYDGTPGVDGVMHDLGTLGGTASGATGINDLGQVVGGSAIAGDLVSHAFRYVGTPNSGGVMHDLGTLGSYSSQANDINNSGQVAGVAAVVGFTSHAFRYDNLPRGGGVMRDLGTLGGNGSWGDAINDSGQVTGYSQLPNGDRHAFRYDGTPGVDGLMRDLGTLDGRESFGHGINNAGFVVGRGSRTSGENVPILWLLDASIIDLDAWLDSVNPTAGAPWFLSDAVGITDTGLIAGTGVFNDGPGGMSDGVRAFVLDASSLIPEPVFAPVLLTLIPLARRSRRRADQDCY